jgi:hypothetical protein
MLKKVEFEKPVLSSENEKIAMKETSQGEELIRRWEGQTSVPPPIFEVRLKINCLIIYVDMCIECLYKFEYQKYHKTCI